MFFAAFTPRSWIVPHSGVPDQPEATESAMQKLRLFGSRVKAVLVRPLDGLGHL
jgi:hypothetical protein